MNWLTRNWRKVAIGSALTLGVALPAFAAVYEKAGLIVPPGSHVKLGDSSALRFGNGASQADPTVFDVTMRWDGTDLDVLANADDSVIKFGNGTESFDIWFYGNTATEYIVWDASADDLIFQDSVSLKLGTGSDAELRWDGTDLDLLAVADDQVFKLGTGTNSWDLWLYGNTSADYLLADASANNLSTQGDYYIGLNDFRRGITTITSDKTVTATESGTVFMVTGGSGVTFTLPTPAAGLTYEFCNVVDQTLTVSASPDKLVTMNNASASTIAYSTSSEKIGGCFDVTGVTGGYFFVRPVLGTETQTPTITD